MEYKKCVICGNEFYPNRKNQTCCSQSCVKARRNAYSRNWSKTHREAMRKHQKEFRERHRAQKPNFMHKVNGIRIPEPVGRDIKSTFEKTKDVSVKKSMIATFNGMTYGQYTSLEFANKKLYQKLAFRFYCEYEIKKECWLHE